MSQFAQAGYIVKVSDQLKLVKNEQQVQMHRLFNEIANRVQRQLETAVPGLRLQLGGKSVQGDVIAMTLSGQMEDTDGNAAEKIQAAIDALPNSKLL
jgi:hypothetical protein